MIYYVTMFALFWIACGVLHQGWGFAFLQSNWPTLSSTHRSEDIRFTLSISLTGPLGLIALLIVASAINRRAWQFGFRLY